MDSTRPAIEAIIRLLFLFAEAFEELRFLHYIFAAQRACWLAWPLGEPPGDAREVEAVVAGQAWQIVTSLKWREADHAIFAHEVLLPNLRQVRHRTCCSLGARDSIGRLGDCGVEATQKLVVLGCDFSKKQF